MAIELIHDRVGVVGDSVPNQVCDIKNHASCRAGMGLGKDAGDCGSSSVSCLDDQLSLISQAYDDYCRRKSRGDEIDIDAFCAEYGEIGSALKQQIEVHDLLLQHTSLIRECIEAVWPKPGDVLRNLSLVAELGRGSFSRVFLARNVALGGRLVVVKVHRGSSREAENLGKLVHDNIVPVTFAEHASDEEFSLLHMPFLGRATLGHVLRRLWRDGRRPRRASEILAAIHESRETMDDVNGMRPDPRWLKASYLDGILAIALQIVEGVAHAHRMGILHLDLKPSNVLITESGCPKVLDFNLSVDRESQHLRLGGTPPYMSPEQTNCFLMGEHASVVDERADVYALGVMLHEMLCGKRPIDCAEGGRLTTTVLRQQLAKQRSAKLDVSWAEYGVNERLGSIVKRCLAPDPEERYPSTASLAWALRREVSLAGRVRRWAGTHRTIVLGAAAILLSVGLGVSHYVAKLDSAAVREYRKAVACQEEGLFPQAVVHLTNCLQTDPDQPYALFRRAQAYVEMKEYQAAIMDLRVLIESVDRGEVFALMGFCCNCRGTDAETIHAYTRALELGYETVGIYCNLGYAHFRRGRLKSALVSLNRAIDLQPNCCQALWNRALVHFAYAVKGDRLPLAAIRDIEGALAIEDAPSGTAIAAYQIYAYAATLNAAFSYRAEFYRQAAILLGAELGTELVQSGAAPYAERAGGDGEVLMEPIDFVDTSRLLNPISE